MVNYVLLKLKAMKPASIFNKLFLSILLTAGFFILSLSLNAQVSGLVTSAETGQALPGVAIRVKNAQNFTATDAQGFYNIEARMGDTLVFSFVGCNSQEIVVTRKEHHVTLAESGNVLSECIVICGYQQASLQSGRINSVEYGRNQEEYRHFNSNAFCSALKEPLSTFSIDVDKASYANVRRFINLGSLPPVDAVRTEELINYFDYDYPKPQGLHPVSISTEVSACPWNPDHRLVHIGLRARDIEAKKLPPSNLIFLIDVSGSMGAANKLPLLKSSLKLLVSQLRDTDRVAIVTYSGETETALASTSGKNKEMIYAAIDALKAQGYTAGGAGIQKAYQEARINFIPKGNNRVILATDGDFNVGLSSEKELEGLIKREKASGVYLTVLGFGMGNYKDNKLQALAQKGNGNHAYIDNISEAKKVLVNEFSGSMYTIARDVKLQVEFNPAKVQAYRLVGYESRLLRNEDFNDDSVDAGEIGVGHTVTALYEVIPAGVKGMVDPLKYQKEKIAAQLTDSPEMLTVKLRYKLPESSKSRKIEQAVVDKQTPLAETSDYFRFSAAVAELGMLLSNSPYLKEVSCRQIADLAREAVGTDPQGYRREFIRLIEAVELLK